MKLPHEVPVMTLPHATLFPQALLPLFIFEPRYRRMLVDSLNTSRMFSVAMQKPGRKREAPSPIAGLGLIRVSVGHDDGTSHLILQGIARVELAETVRYKPYRVQRIRPLESPPCNDLVIDALVDRVRELMEDWMKFDLPLPMPFSQGTKKTDKLEGYSARHVVEYLEKLADPEQIADMVTCAVLSGPVERQTILETVNLEDRLKHLIHFLMAEIARHRKDRKK